MLDPFVRWFPEMTNQSLRERFDLPDNKAETVSRIISDAVNERLVKFDNPDNNSGSTQSMFRTGHKVLFRHKHVKYRGIVKKTCNIKVFLFRRKIHMMSVETSNGCYSLDFENVRGFYYGTS